MLVYSLKRLGRALITLVILITIVFILVRAMPEEGYFSNYEKMSPQQIEVGLRKMGLKDPLYVQVGKFIYNALRGDLGISYRYRINAKITDIISSKIGISMKIGLISMVVSLPLGMALGVLMARSKGGFADKLGNAYIVFIQAVPNAVYFIFIQLYGSDLFRVSMLYKETEWTSLILPVISLALPSISGGSQCRLYPYRPRKGRAEQHHMVPPCFPQFRGAYGQSDPRFNTFDHIGFNIC